MKLSRKFIDRYAAILLALTVALGFAVTTHAADTTVTYDKKSDYGVQATYWRMQSFHCTAEDVSTCQVYLGGYPSVDEASDGKSRPLEIKTVNVTLSGKVFTDALAALQEAVQTELDAESP